MTASSQSRWIGIPVMIIIYIGWAALILAVAKRLIMRGHKDDRPSARELREKQRHRDADRAEAVRLDLYSSLKRQEYLNALDRLERYEAEQRQPPTPISILYPPSED